MFKDFISNEERPYAFRIGRMLASSLSGFIAGGIGGALAIWIYLATKSL